MDDLGRLAVVVGWRHAKPQRAGESGVRSVIGTPTLPRPRSHFCTFGQQPAISPAFALRVSSRPCP